MDENTTFESLGIQKVLVETLKKIGITKPTPIQANCIPHILKGEDVIGCAQTGSGKTAAFALPILNHLLIEPYGIFCLVLAPTRELAHQIFSFFADVGKQHNFRAMYVTGGGSMVDQGKELQNHPEVVVACPGRLADHIRSGTTFSLKKIKYLVLDEADRLLEDNFGEDLQLIFSKVAEKRQTLLFSATMTESLRTLEAVATNKPFFWHANDPVKTVDSLDQRMLVVSSAHKDAYLMHFLDQYQAKNPNSLIIIFVQFCKFCQVLGMMCKSMGFEPMVLHSLTKQKYRVEALNKFKAQECKILIATDVASRGLDIPDVNLVINYNVPSRPKDYVHRVGRTARAGNKGRAVTFVSEFEAKLMLDIEEHINKKMDKLVLKDSEVAKIMVEVAVAKRAAELKLDNEDFEEKKEINKRKRLILEGKNPDVPSKKRKRRDFEKKMKKKIAKKATA